MGVNYGLNKVRFTAPVPAGSRVRGRLLLKGFEPVAGNGVQATNYFLGTKYVEALARMGSSNNAKVFFLPVEAAGVMASIAGIGELAKEAQARGAVGEANRPRGSVPSSG